MTPQRTDFEVRTPVNVVAFTAPSRDLAVAWIKSRPNLPGLTVKEVTSWKTERTVYRPRPRLVGADDLAIPKFPERKSA